MRLQFKRFAAAALVTVMVGALAGCGTQASSTTPKAGGKYAGRTLTIMSNGGYYLDSLKKYVITPFEQQTGGKVNVVEATSVQMLNRLRAEKAAPTIDFVSISEMAAVSGRSEGLFQKLDPSKIPNLADVAPNLKNPDGYGVQSVLSPIVPVYNTDKVKTAPTSWADFWSPAFKGKVVSADVANTMGPLMLVTAAKLNGGDENNIEPGFAKMVELKANLAYIYKGEGQEVPQALGQGDLYMAPMMLVKAMDLVKNNAPVKVVIPKEGAWPLPYTLEVVAGSKNADMAFDFYNMALSVPAQEGFAKDLYVTPSNTKAQIPDDLKSVLPTADHIMTINWAAMSKNMSAWTDEWKSKIAQ